MQFFDPKNDVMFKALLTQGPELLADIIERVLDLPAPPTEVTVLNPELARDFAADKGGVLDVRCRIGDGRLIDLEMQVDVRPVLRKRLLFYWAKNYTSELAIGDDHHKLRPAICIAWLARNLLEGDRMHSIFELAERRQHSLFLEDIELHLFELSKLRPEDMHRDRAAIWARFFRFESPEDIEQLAKEYPIMSQAKVILHRLSEDERLAGLAEDRERARLNWLIEKQGEREEGREEGKCEQLREAIVGLCEVLDLAVTDTKRQSLEAMSWSELEATWKRIKTERRWG